MIYAFCACAKFTESGTFSSVVVSYAASSASATVGFEVVARSSAFKLLFAQAPQATPGRKVTFVVVRSTPRGGMRCTSLSPGEGESELS